MEGGKPKFAQINKRVNWNFLKLQDGKPKFSQITGGEIFHEGLKPKNLQITRMKFKKYILQEWKAEMTYITGSKTLLTLIYTINPYINVWYIVYNIVVDQIGRKKNI